MSKFRISLRFEPRDMWAGIYWNRQGGLAFDVFICIIPMFPIMIRWWRGRYTRLISFGY